MSSVPEEVAPEKKRDHPFRRAVLRGLGVVLPPLLTVVIFAWVWSTLRMYILEPVTYGTQSVMAWYMADVRTEADMVRWNLVEIPGGTYIPKEVLDSVRSDPGPGAEPETVQAIYLRYGQLADKPAPTVAAYQELPRTRELIPYRVFRIVSTESEGMTLPRTATDYYRRFVEIEYLRDYILIPLYLSTFILLMYFLGKFLAAGIGRWLWSIFEWLIHRLPLVSNVYGSVKQVTDFMLSESDLSYTRVVAVEYPRMGIWSLGFVTGESMWDVAAAANEPVLAVLIPTSPAPVTGYTVNVKRSEVIDLNITVDQALQFCISCGVVVPPHQLYSRTADGMMPSMPNGLKEKLSAGSSSTPAALPPQS